MGTKCPEMVRKRKSAKQKAQEGGGSGISQKLRTTKRYMDKYMYRDK